TQNFCYRFSRIGQNLPLNLLLGISAITLYFTFPAKINADSYFEALMRFMGDQPDLKKQDKMDYIYDILQVCDKKTLHDEVYCQVIKQITGNPNMDSCHLGWQLLSLLTGYFLPSSTLRPYITQFLQQICCDSTHHCSGTWLVSSYSLVVKNLWWDFPCSQSIHHQPFISEYVLKQICEDIGVTELEEIQEFAILANKDKGKMIRPLHQEEYVLDYLLEESSIELHFCRITWKIPLHFDNEIYINIHYNQVLQKYMTGTLLLQQTNKLGQQLGILALLQHWARGMATCPGKHAQLMWFLPMCLTYYTPSYLVSLLAEHVIQLPLFGYNVFSVERISAPDISLPCIVGVNQEEIVVMSKETQSNQIIIPLKQILRMKSLRPFSAAGFPGIEINYGSIENPKTIWFELQQVTSVLSLFPPPIPRLPTNFVVAALKTCPQG
uniref:MyTH4 domain-containing protein n=1 Tax=Laticauda laticaudata TaxID=8630 RepID=A0A8C5WVX0_LATLA